MMVSTDQPLTSVLPKPEKLFANGLPFPKGKIIDNADGSNVSYVVRCRSPISSDVVRIRYQTWSVACGCLVQRVTIVERLGPGVDAAKRKAVVEMAIDVNLQRVVAAVAP